MWQIEPIITPQHPLTMIVNLEHKLRVMMKAICTSNRHATSTNWTLSIQSRKTRNHIYNAAKEAAESNIQSRTHSKFYRSEPRKQTRTTCNSEIYEKRTADTKDSKSNLVIWLGGQSRREKKEDACDSGVNGEERINGGGGRHVGTRRRTRSEGEAEKAGMEIC